MPIRFSEKAGEIPRAAEPSTPSLNRIVLYARSTDENSFLLYSHSCGIPFPCMRKEMDVYTTGSTQEFDPESVYALAGEGIIFGAVHRGVVKWNRKNGSFTRYTTEDGLL